MKTDSWLTPEGNIIEVGKFGHNEYAYDLLDAEFGMRKLHEYMENNNCESATEVMHTRGWIRIELNTEYLPRVQFLGNCIDLTKPMTNTIDPEMNNIQINVALKLCDKFNTTFHMAINDKRFW